MPLSSDYATPIELDLRTGPLERICLGLGIGCALAGLLTAQLPTPWRLALMLVLTWLAWRANRQLAARAGVLVLYADGLVACGSRDEARPVELIQASGYGPALLLSYRDAGHLHAWMLFPDRVGLDARHRLRLWLAAHRPQPLGVAA